MKVLFIKAEKKFKSAYIDIKENLPKNLHILYTIQYKPLAEKLTKQLEKKGHKIIALQQILGCSKIKLKATPLLIADGKFHIFPLLESKEIFIYNGKLNKIGKKEIDSIKRKEKAKITKFLASKNIGLLFSLKPGQNRLKELAIKQKLKDKFRNKSFYVFLDDNINFSETENFYIDFWLNVSCPGIESDSDKILNYEKVLKEIYF